MVLFLPLLTISRRYCAARYVFFVREAAHAAWQRARRNQTLPLRVFCRYRKFSLDKQVTYGRRGERISWVVGR
jgi:hypothetical protein